MWSLEGIDDRAKELQDSVVWMWQFKKRGMYCTGLDKWNELEIRNRMMVKKVYRSYVGKVRQCGRPRTRQKDKVRELWRREDLWRVICIWWKTRHSQPSI